MGRITALPEAEIGTDLAQAFSRIAKGLILLGFTNWKPYIARVAWDCIPPLRAHIMKDLADGPRHPRQLAASLRIPDMSLRKHIAHLVALKIVAEDEDAVRLRITLPEVKHT